MVTYVIHFAASNRYSSEGVTGGQCLFSYPGFNQMYSSMINLLENDIAILISF